MLVRNTIALIALIGKYIFCMTSTFQS